MATLRTETIALTNDECGSSQGELRTRLFNAGDRWKRAAMGLALCWGLAVLSLPIMGLHWILVPGFLIAGPIVAYKRYVTGFVMENATGVCPACRNEVAIRLDPGDRIPKWTYCPNCNKPLQLVYHYESVCRSI